MKTTTLVLVLVTLLYACGATWALGAFDIGDTVWYDANKDGVQQSGELGIEGVTVKLTGAIDGNTGLPVDLYATTDADGHYIFSVLDNPATFTVEVVSGVPSGYVQTWDSDSHLGPFPAGNPTVSKSLSDSDYNLSVTTNFDFGYYQPMIQSTPSVELIKTGPTDCAKRGATITYHFKVTNTGNTVLDIYVTDPMLGGTTAIWFKLGVQPGEVNEFDRTYTIPLTGALPNETATASAASSLQALCYTPPPCPPPPPTEKLVNVATATGIATGLPTVTDDSTWTVVIDNSKCTPASTPGILLVKTGPATAKRGDTVTYHFKVTNTGNTALSITVNDPMLGGDIWQKSSVAAGVVSQFDVTYTIPRSGNLIGGCQARSSSLQQMCYGRQTSCRTTTEKLVNTATATGCLSGRSSVTDDSSWTITVSGSRTPPTGSIGNCIWRDDDRDGRKGYREDGLGCVTVTLCGDFDGDGRNETRMTSTNCRGEYKFSCLYAGSYTVRVSGPRGYTCTRGGGDCTTVNLQDGESKCDVDFGYCKPYSGGWTRGG